ncbi:MAG TPA: hypothetical protein VGV67_05970, partial [Solirubrobacteraceae bacterium]|nr:hypothetical protein [Solirubrobacteraceae bacterium]
RAAAALALSVAALALAFGGLPASAATQSLLTDNGTDPSAVPGSVAWQLPGGAGLVSHDGGSAQPLPGTDPALGPDTVAWREGETIVVAERRTLRELLRVPAPGIEELAISARWLVWRALEPAGDVLRALDLQAPAQPAFDLRRVPAPARIGRPSLDADRVVFHVAQRRASRIEEIHLPAHRRTTLRAGRNGAQLLNPSEEGGELVYVSSSAERQLVLAGPRRLRRGVGDRRLLRMHPVVRRDAGHEPGRKRHNEGYPGRRAPRLPERAPPGVTVTLWSTALAPGVAYVTRIRRTVAGTSSVIVRLTR